jgi:hypothetical protein
VLVEVADLPLGVLMHRIGTRFARVAQKRVPTTGHHFERRYHAVLVDVDAYLLAVLRYIHMNPVQAGIVADPSDYRWSSHDIYVGRRQVPWVTTHFGLALFSPRIAEAQTAAEICAEHGIVLSELISSQRRSDFNRARDAFAARAVREGIASQQEVAVFLSRSAAAISRSAARGQRAQRRQERLE